MRDPDEHVRRRLAKGSAAPRGQTARPGSVVAFARTLLAVLGALASAQLCAADDVRPQPAAEPPRSVMGTSAEVVELEVLVSDEGGKPVTGLRAEDFEVRDDGRPRELSHFAHRGVGAEEAEGDSDRPRPPSSPLAADESRRAIVFVIDTLHMGIDSVMGTRKMLEDFIDREMMRGDLVLIMPTSGGSGILQQLMTDRRMLRRAAGRLQPFSAMAAYFPRGTFDTINNVVEAVAHLPGRKIVILVSEGFPRIADDAFRTDFGFDLSETSARTTRSNVILYAVNPLGLEGPIESADEKGWSDAPTAGTRGAGRRENDSTLRALAEATGGKAFLHRNDMAGAVHDVLEENAYYYVLGFLPEDREWDKKYHRLQVSVRGRRDLAVSTRRGYLARADTPRARKGAAAETAEVVEAVSSPLVRRDIDVVLTLLYSDDERGQPRLVTLLHIDAAPLVFKDVAGQKQVQLERVGYLFDASGKAVDSFRTVAALDFGENAYREALRRGLLATHATKVKPGLYQARVLVRDAESGLIGTSSTFVEIPKMKGGRLALSSIFADVRYLQEPGSGAANEGGTLSQRRFPRGGEFGYRLLIYNAKVSGGDTRLTLETRILRRAEVVQETPETPVEALEGSTPQRIAAGGTVRLGALEPDEYTLELIVTDKLQAGRGRSVARQEIDFAID